MSQEKNTTLRLLSVGNAYSRDCLQFLGPLAAVFGTQVEITCLDKWEGTLRLHARNAAQDKADYDVWKYTPEGGWSRTEGKTSIARTLSEGGWDLIMLQQGLLTAGMYGTYNSDLDFLLDYLADRCPSTPVYWNMTWAYGQNVTGGRASDLEVCYDSSPAVMYNAIIDSLGQCIVGEKARFARRFAGWFPVGAVIQDLRTAGVSEPTRDGVHLSEGVGRLAAAMTILKALCPDADLNAITPSVVANLPGRNGEDAGDMLLQIRKAVESACGDLTRLPARVDAPRPVRIEDVSGPENVTIARTPTPYKLHFPDSAVTRDGTVFVSAYENVFHYPDTEAGDSYGWQGCGRLLIWKSTDNGKTFDTDNPVLVIDEDQLDRWGVAKTTDRYNRWKNGENDYILNADPRDPNFGIVYADINGDGVKEEVLLYTFCMVNYHEEHISHSLNMNWSIDGGKTWSVPQELESVNSPVLVKRGDLAAFSDGQILVPTYFRNKIVLLLMQWSVREQKWVNVHDTVLPDPAPEKTGTYEYNEMSLFAPDPDGDVVYGFIRANAAVVKSYDRSRTWQMIGMEDGLIHQPGFTQLDEDRVFVTWARITAPRTVYGKVYYFNGDWSDTVSRTIYTSPDVRGHDMADPSCRLLVDGQVYTVSYDTAYRAIVGTFDDPDSEEFLPVEMDKRAGEAVLYENCAPADTLTVDALLPGSYTVCVQSVFEAGGELTVTMAGGSVVRFCEGTDGIRKGEPVCVRVLAVGDTTYRQVTAVGAEPAGKWTRAAAADARAAGKVTCSTKHVTMDRVRLSHRVSIQMNGALEGIVGGSDELRPIVRPVQPVENWSSSDPAIALVEDGKVTYVGAGSAVISCTAGGVSAQCQITVAPMPAELTGEGEKQILFADDYQRFPVGENAFWEHMEAAGYCSNGSVPTHASAYDIEEENGKKHLKLTAYSAKRTWHKINVPVHGDYSVRFDFRFTGGRTVVNAMAPGHCLYINLWQDSNVHGFLQLTPEGMRCEYQGQDGGLVTDPELFGDDVIYTLNEWHTARISRVNGGLYAKVWLAGEKEPERWDFVALHKQLDTNNTAYPRMLYYASGPVPRSVCVRDLEVSRQVTTCGQKED